MPMVFILLSVCSLSNIAVSNSDYAVLNDWMTVNNELEMMWKEAVVAQFEVLHWQLPGQTQENLEKLSLDNQYPDRDLNHVPP
jgi:hypothetical protein